MQVQVQAYEGREPFIFVAYAHEDAASVCEELRYLNDKGFNVWYDEGINPGSSWRDEVADRILAANWFLYFVSPNSVRSPHCLKEVNFAIDANKPLIVVHLEETSLPLGLRLALVDIQALLKYELSESSYERKLLSTLSKQAGKDLPLDFAGNVLDAADDSASIAVLPFINMSGDTAQDYFCDGTTEEIINGLAGIPALKVIARTSSFAFKGKSVDVRTIGERLSVNHVLEGSVRKSGNRVRITAQLIAVRDGAHIWSGRFDRELADVFECQDAITAEILRALDCHLGSRRPELQTVDVEAYKAMLLGRYHAHRMEYPLAFQAYQRALSIEPEYADVHAGLAQIYDVQDNIARNQEIRQLSDAHIDKALSLEPHQSMALCIRLQRRYVAGELQYALDAFAELLERRPNDYAVLTFYGSFLTAILEEEMSLKIHARMVELDPLNALCHSENALALGTFGYFDAARQACGMARQLGLPVAGTLAALAYEEGDLDALKAQLARPKEEWGVRYHYYSLLASAVPLALGDHDEAERILANNVDPAFGVSNFDKYLLAAFRGDWSAAAESLRRGIQSGEWLSFAYALGKIGLHEQLADMYQSPAYLQMLEDAGLDKASLGRLVIHPLPF